MNYQAIKVSVRDDLAVITLNRPDVMNALNTQMRAEILYAVRDVEHHARAIVMTGQGNAFCSGQDLGDAASIGAVDMERTLRDEYEPMLNAIYDCAIPTMSAVNGAAAGAGANLALASDVVIATDSAVFLQAFARIGLIPDAGGTYWLPRQIGFPRAMGAALFAEPVNAQKAVEWGMIFESVPDANFADHWQSRARTLASGPTVAYRNIKTAMRAASKHKMINRYFIQPALYCGPPAHLLQPGNAGHLG